MAIRFTSDHREGNSHLPEGTYRLRILDVEQTEAKKTKTPQLKVTAQVASGEYAERKVVDFFPLSEAALWRLYKLAEACNVRMEDTGEVDERGKPIMELEPEDLIGAECYAVAKIREYEGRKSNNWVEFTSTEETLAGTPESEDDEEPVKRKSKGKGKGKVEEKPAAKKGKKPEPEPEEDEDEDEDEEEAPRRGRPAKNKPEAKAAKVEDDIDDEDWEDDEDDEDDEEDEPTPPPSRRRRKG